MPPARQRKPLPAGIRVGRYTLLHPLAAGGFGVVYQARSDQQSDVAIKEFFPAFIGSRAADGIRIEPAPAERHKFEQGIQSFFAEADRLAHLNHPRVIRVLDLFAAHGTAYLVMPLEPGGTLREWMRHGRRPSDAQLLHWGVQAAEGVEAMHRGNLLHLDLKPSNLWERPDGSLLVLDLGASRWKEAANMGQGVRTPGYAAPEQQASTHPPLTVATDVYGLCATLWALAEGQHPPDASSRHARDMMSRQARRGQRSFQMMSVIDRGMDLDVNGRWRTAETVRRALLSIQDADESSPRPIAPLAVAPPADPIQSLTIRE